MKIIVIGNVSTGKTSFCRRYAYGEYTTNYKATVGVDFVAKGDFQLWDIAGQERFGAVTRAYYRGAVGALVVIDSSQADGIDAAQKWVDDLRKKYEEPIPIVVVANKSDLPLRVSLEDLDSFCKGNPNVVGWLATSVKNNVGVEEAMQKLAAHLPREDDASLGSENDDEVFIDLMKQAEQREGSCC